jgi:CubicO group peptidase (beta-lactamase class C family)
VRYIAAIDPNSPDAPRIHSVLVARKGKLVLEEYFFGYTADDTHDLRSASKTFTGLMAGIAIDKGEFTIDTPVYAVLDSLARRSDPRRGRMTVGNLLTHTSGLACDDNDDNSPGNEEKLWGGQLPDWYGYTLGLPMAKRSRHDLRLLLRGHQPGRRRRLGDHRHRTAGVLLPEHLAADADGHVAHGAHARRPRLRRRRHLHASARLPQAGPGVPERRELERVAGGEPQVGGTVGDAARPGPDSSHDGYAWHLHTLSHDGKAYREYDASGNGGQLMIVLPELDIVVAFTAGNYNR